MIVNDSEWGSHPFLSKLSSQHDYDGWFSYLTIKHPTKADIALASKVTLQYCGDDQKWMDAEYSESVPFIDFVSFGWSRKIKNDGEQSQFCSWRAVLPD